MNMPTEKFCCSLNIKQLSRPLCQQAGKWRKARTCKGRRQTTATPWANKLAWLAGDRRELPGWRELAGRVRPLRPTLCASVSTGFAAISNEGSQRIPTPSAKQKLFQPQRHSREGFTVFLLRQARQARNRAHGWRAPE